MSECAIGLGRAGLIRALSSWDYRKRSICHEFSDLSRHRLLDLNSVYKVYHVSDLFRPTSTAINITLSIINVQLRSLLLRREEYTN